MCDASKVWKRGRNRHPRLVFKRRGHGGEGEEASRREREQTIRRANNNQLDATLFHSITQCLADTPLGKSSPFALQSMLKIKVEITDGIARVLIKYSVSTAG